MQRIDSRQGIAIGPILFIIAILAILATAISAGSSTFASNSGQEANRTNAAAIIQIGANLKLGVDRIVALGTPLANVDINASNTSASNSIFSPLGGGLVPPATTLANTPGTDVWYYTWGGVTSLGTSAKERLAILRVSSGVCDQINTQANAGTYITYGDMGAFNNSTNLATDIPLLGKMVGCFNGNNATNNGTYFYQVPGVQ